MPTSVYKINRKHTIDDTYFDNINSERKAYWLGFIWADGSLSQTAKRCSGHNRLSISQKLDEIQHLEKFKADIKSNAIIHVREPMTNKYVAILDINSRPLCITLESMGYAVKSKRIHIPQIPNDLIRHFIRGYFDGDGCLSIYDQHVKQWVVHRQEFSITGNPILITEIQKTLNANTSVSKTVKLKTYAKTKSVVSLRYGKKSDINELYHYLYDDAHIYLDDKYQKFIDYYSRQS